MDHEYKLLVYMYALVCREPWNSPLLVLYSSFACVSWALELTFVGFVLLTFTQLQLFWANMATAQNLAQRAEPLIGHW